MNKSDVVRAIERALSSKLDGLVRAAEAALDEATHSESKAENKYDTRSLEASYLAGGQTERLIELKRRLAYVRVLSTDPLPSESPAQAGALIHVEEEERTWWCFLAPGGGGLKVEVAGEQVVVVCPTSPVGRALLGLREDEEASVPARSGVRELVVLTVR